MARVSYLRRIAGLPRSDARVVRLSPPPLMFRPGVTAADFMVIDQRLPVSPRPFMPVLRDPAASERARPTMTQPVGAETPPVAPASGRDVASAVRTVTAPHETAMHQRPAPRETIRVEPSTGTREISRTPAVVAAPAPLQRETTSSSPDATPRSLPAVAAVSKPEVAYPMAVVPAAAPRTERAGTSATPAAERVVAPAVQPRIAAPVMPRPVLLPAPVPPRPAATARVPKHRASSVQIGVIEVRVAPPPAPAATAMPATTAPARTTVLRTAGPVSRLARGYGAFGLVQS